MPKRELRQFEYTCDGHLRDGTKCTEHTRIEAISAYIADQIVSEPHKSTGWGWTHTQHGWLCYLAHKNDPKLREKVEP